MSSFSGAVFSLNSKSPPATISARRMSIPMKFIDTMLHSRILVSAVSLAFRRFNLRHLHSSLPRTKKM
eukprot:8862168-Heterocapsa_arctica.AAC.1